MKHIIHKDEQVMHLCRCPKCRQFSTFVSLTLHTHGVCDRCDYETIVVSYSIPAWRMFEPGMEEDIAMLRQELVSVHQEKDNHLASRADAQRISPAQNFKPTAATDTKIASSKKNTNFLNKQKKGKEPPWK